MENTKRTLSELVAERRARIDVFNAHPPEEMYAFEAGPDISQLGDDIQRTPIRSQDDALAALDLIASEIEPERHLAVSMVAALRKYLGEIEL